MDEDAIRRARDRLAGAAAGEPRTTDVDAALERTRLQLESLAESAAELQAALPGRVGDAVRDGVRAEALPVARQLAEVRGLTSHVIRRLERLDGDFLADRHARVDDLALLVDLVSSGWRAVDERLSRIEDVLGRHTDAVVYSLRERRSG